MIPAKREEDFIYNQCEYPQNKEKPLQKGVVWKLTA